MAAAGGGGAVWGHDLVDEWEDGRRDIVDGREDTATWRCDVVKKDFLAWAWRCYVVKEDSSPRRRNVVDRQLMLHIQ